ncbi:MAG: hypothetical protein WKG06_29880 [Segetibacter sp.]
MEQKFNATPDNPIPYKVAWVGGCVMYDTEKLREVGGFSFWKDLPEKHCGEDVLGTVKSDEKIWRLRYYSKRRVSPGTRNHSAGQKSERTGIFRNIKKFLTAKSAK